MRYIVLLCLFYSLTSLAQNERYKLTEKDTLVTCSFIDRSSVHGPFSDTHSADFENLAKAVFKASPFPEYPYSIFRTKESMAVRLGCHSYDELEYHTFLLYNVDSAMEFNLKAKTRFGLMSILAHEVGHHAFNHFMPWPEKNIVIQELQADYFAGWLLAKLQVPQADITKGVRILSEENKNSRYPHEKDRANATMLGYTIATTAGAGPLEVLERGEPITEAWLKKWSRGITPSTERTDVTESVFANVHLEFDNLGQLIYKHKDKYFVLARVMPSKNTRYAFLLFDNQFNYWWIGKDGSITDAKEEKVLGVVNLSILAKN